VKHDAAADESITTLIEYFDECPQVISTRVAVVVREGQDLTACARQPHVPCVRQSGSGGMDALNGKRRVFSELIEDATVSSCEALSTENELPAAGRRLERGET
jgi:hypothetical protein